MRLNSPICDTHEILRESQKIDISKVLINMDEDTISFNNFLATIIIDEKHTKKLFTMKIEQLSFKLIFSTFDKAFINAYT